MSLDKVPPQRQLVTSEFTYYASLDDMPETSERERVEKQMVIDAREIVKRSTAPDLKVGSSIRAVDGRVVSCPNTPDWADGTGKTHKGLHAEMHALWELYAQGVVNGGRNKVTTIAIAGEPNGTADPKMCGNCMSRMMRNTANVAYPNSAIAPTQWEDVTVLILLNDGRIKKTTLNSMHNNEHVHFNGTNQDVSWLQDRVKELMSEKAKKL